MIGREQVRVAVFDGEEYDGDWPAKYGDTLIGAIAWFNAKLALIPAEYRSSARCQIHSVGGYEGDRYGRIQIDYWRPETDEEMAERLTKAADAIEKQQQREINALRALRAKYPGMS